MKMLVIPNLWYFFFLLLFKTLLDAKQSLIEATIKRKSYTVKEKNSKLLSSSSLYESLNAACIMSHCHSAIFFHFHDVVLLHWGIPLGGIKLLTFEQNQSNDCLFFFEKEEIRRVWISEEKWKHRLGLVTNGCDG